MKRLAVLALLAGCPQPYALTATTPEWVRDTTTFAQNAKPAAPTLSDRYRQTAAKIIAAATRDRSAYKRLSELTDTIGHRISGSPQLEQAVQWAAASMKADGLDVRTEKVMVPHWVRGNEQAEIVKPIARPLTILGLGGTIATPKGDITAPIVVVHSWQELDAKAESVKGAIVVYNVAMPPYSDEKGSGYGETVQFRGKGASAAAKRGAVAALVRSVTAHSLRTPHTGAMGYEEGTPKIPVASITVEDAELLDRLSQRGPVSVRLHLEAQMLPDAESANVIGDLRGTEKPDEIVLLGAHLDSWDVGQGAHDDGAGCVMLMHAVSTLKQLGLVPRRTIRIVLFTNEENGLRGGKAYAKDHEAELPKHVLALESDSGGFAPHGLGIDHKDDAVKPKMLARVQDIGSLVRSLGITKYSTNHGGADISQMKPAGVPQMGLETEGRTYFDIHHTNADTLDKVDPAALAADVAVIAVVAFVIADMPDRIDAP